MIAHLILSRPAPPARVGAISLRPHQTEAITRIKLAFEEFRGAFLCDAVGTGKTYIGLAVAREMSNPIIIAPAALREMWLAAITAGQCDARFVSVEALSYGVPSADDCGGLVVDEAHHFRNANTLRYRALSKLAHNRNVLLMTATPIHNSQRDFGNLAALFLGERARHLTSDEMTRLVIRRRQSCVQVAIPEVTRTEWLDVGDDAEVSSALLALPPPVPLKDAGEAATLLAHGLVRQWSSSEAALIAALRRRRTRAAALESALESGQHPTEDEIRGWILGDDAVQLRLPFLLTARVDDDCAGLLRAVQAHSAALAKLSDELRASRTLDDERARLLREIRLAHPYDRIVAFSSYEATVAAMFERLNRSNRVACLTARGARVAGGRITRAEAIRQFDPSAPEARECDRIDLLLTTDLLSEGVNLQRAGVVVHLDLPWTSARVEQRVGRVARAGSAKRSVAVFGFRPPPSAERVLRAAAIVQLKWHSAAETVGRGSDPVFGGCQKPAKASPEIHEAVREILETWSAPLSASAETPAVAAVEADEPGFLVVVEVESRCVLLCNVDGGSLEPTDILQAAVRASARDVPVCREACDGAVRQIARWMSDTMSKDIAGLTDAPFLRSRRKVFTRINSLAAASAPHTRMQQERMIRDVRAAASKTLDAEGERAVATLAKISDAESARRWLAGNSISSPSAAAAGRSRCRIRALLLFLSSRQPSS